MNDFRYLRRAAKVAQRDVSKISGVSVWKLSMAECGQIELKASDERAVREALRRNLQNVARLASEVRGKL
jgi:predicted transcriptional regulator